MIYITYDPVDGRAAPDFIAMNIAKRAVDYIDPVGDDVRWFFSTSNVIEAILTLISEEKADHKNIAFIINGKEYRANTYGVILNQPESLLDQHADWAELRVINATKRHKAAKASAEGMITVSIWSNLWCQIGSYKCFRDGTFADGLGPISQGIDADDVPENVREMAKEAFSIDLSGIEPQAKPIYPHVYAHYVQIKNRP